MMKHFLTSVLTFIIFSTPAVASDTNGIETEIPYSSKNDRYSKERLKLDVYRPDNVSNAPVVIWFHGGGLTGGSKSIPPELMNSGFVVIAPNYRLTPHVNVEDCIDDAAEAVAWAFANAEKYGGDKSKIIVSGHSAGGFLTSMVGLDKSRLDRYGVNADSISALIPYSGQVITHFSDRKKMGIDPLTPLIDRNAPLFHVRKDAPPYIIITGDAEGELYGRYEENLYMWRMMRLTGHPDVKIYKIDGHDHGQMVHPAHHILKKEIERILHKKESPSK